MELQPDIEVRYLSRGKAANVGHALENREGREVHTVLAKSRGRAWHPRYKTLVQNDLRRWKRVARLCPKEEVSDDEMDQRASSLRSAREDTKHHSQMEKYKVKRGVPCIQRRGMTRE